jgi:inorganic phosphate transporter, PiT family
VQAIATAARLQRDVPAAPPPVTFVAARDSKPGLVTDEAKTRSGVRNDVYQLISQLRHAEQAPGIGAGDKNKAKSLAASLGQAVAYAPWWVRVMSALCLGIGTMIGYRRIVETLGERLGNVHLTPAQGAAAELVSAVLIGTSGFSGLPVSTTHIVTSGIGGTMVSSGAGLRYGMLWRIAIAWLVTLPVTMVLAGGIYYLLANPGLGVAT